MIKAYIRPRHDSAVCTTRHSNLQVIGNKSLFLRWNSDIDCRIKSKSGSYKSSGRSSSLFTKSHILKAFSWRCRRRESKKPAILLSDCFSCVRNKTRSILYKLKELVANPLQVSDWFLSFLRHSQADLWLVLVFPWHSHADFWLVLVFSMAQSCAYLSQVSDWFLSFPRHSHANFWLVLVFPQRSLAPIPRRSLIGSCLFHDTVTQISD